MTVVLKQKLSDHCPNPLVSVYKGMIGSESVSDPCDFFSPDICNYSEKGRAKIHEMQKAVNPIILQKLMEHPIQGQSAELKDNRISLYVAPRGKCAICKEPLLLGNMEVHHLTPRSNGGKDNYSNLALVTGDVHKLIHAVDPVIIQKYLDKLNMVKLNKFQLLAGDCKFEYR
ncbi:HNH endonuclease [Anaerotruncus rubiinfantis]|uniref:HNH endonuclease n=2 Tax=Anaerotruncus rubiinfantis TaxID=1720200 RepID=UPI003C2DD5D0